MIILERIADFQKVLRNDASSDKMSKWWTHVRLIDSALGFDPHTTNLERDFVWRLKKAVSDALIDVRNGRAPSISGAGVHLSALQDSIERRTIGPDGNPLRK